MTTTADRVIATTRPRGSLRDRLRHQGRRLRHQGRRLRARTAAAVGPWIALARAATLPLCSGPSSDR